jgi:hypothetical protein
VPVRGIVLRLAFPSLDLTAIARPCTTKRDGGGYIEILSCVNWFRQSGVNSCLEFMLDIRV